MNEQYNFIENNLDENCVIRECFIEDNFITIPKKIVKLFLKQGHYQFLISKYILEKMETSK